MAEYFDAEETRDPAMREAALLARLPEFIAYARAEAPGWARHLRGIGAGESQAARRWRRCRCCVSPICPGCRHPTRLSAVL